MGSYSVITRISGSAIAIVCAFSRSTWVRGRGRDGGRGRVGGQGWVHIGHGQGSGQGCGVGVSGARALAIVLLAISRAMTFL